MPARGGETSSRARRKSGPRSWAVPLILLVVVGLFFFHAHTLRFTQDDAYISMRYAKNLVEGNGLVFNVGERVEGYTNFSWTLLLALFMKLGLPLPAAGGVAGALFAAGAILVAARFARALEGRWGPRTITTAALLAGNSALALWSTGGLETGLFTFLVTAAFERGFAPDVSPKGRMWAPVLFVLASLTRPEGPLLFALYFGLRHIFPREDGTSVRRALLDAAIFVAPMTVYAFWKLSYFGDLLPNTYYAKAGFTWEYLKRGLTYAKEYFFAYGAFGLVPALALFSVFPNRTRGPEMRLLLAWLGFALYIVWVGGDVLYVHRFWLPILPIGCVLVAAGAGAAVERFFVQRGNTSKAVAGWRAPGPLLGALTLVLVTLGISLNWTSIQSRRNLERVFVNNMRLTGEWLREHMAPGSSLAIATIGAISYTSGLHVIDLLGLTDREIARNPKPLPGLTDTWREISYNAESVIRRRPDAIMFSTGVRPSSAAEKALFFYRNFHETYIPYYFRNTPSRASTQTLFRPKPEAPPVELSLLPVDNTEFIDAYSDAHLAQSLRRDQKEAAELFRQAYELSGGHFRWAKEWWATALYDLRDPRGSSLLHEVAQEDPYALTALVRLADEALRKADLDTAERFFEQVRVLDPDDSIPWGGLSEVFRQKGEFQKALDFAREAAARWDTNANHLVMWGNLEASAGNLDVAKSAFQRALRVEPNLTQAQRGLYLIEEIRAGRMPEVGDSSQTSANSGNTPSSPR